MSVTSVLDSIVDVTNRGCKQFWNLHNILLSLVQDNIFTRPTQQPKDNLPTAAVIAMGSAISSGFRTGLLLSIIGIAVSAGILLTQNKKGHETSSAYHSAIQETHPFHTDVTASVLEEIEFRGILLPFISAVTRSPTTGVIGSSLLFGAAHLHNNHEHRYMQACYTATLGLAEGFLYYKFGLIAPIAMHIGNNFLDSIMNEIGL